MAFIQEGVERPCQRSTLSTCEWANALGPRREIAMSEPITSTIGECLLLPKVPGPTGAWCPRLWLEQRNRHGEELGLRSHSLTWMSSLDRTFPPMSFLRAWISASSVASWPDLKDADLWFRHMPYVVMSRPCSVILDIVASTAGGSSLNRINCLQNTCCFHILTQSLPETPISVSWWHTTHGLSSVSAHAIHFILLKAIFPSSPLSLHRLSPGNYILMFPDPDPISSPLQNLCGAGPLYLLAGQKWATTTSWTNLPVTVF